MLRSLFGCLLALALLIGGTATVNAAPVEAGGKPTANQAKGGKKKAKGKKKGKGKKKAGKHHKKGKGKKGKKGKKKPA